MEITYSVLCEWPCVVTGSHENQRGRHTRWQRVFCAPVGHECRSGRYAVRLLRRVFALGAERYAKVR